MTLWILTSLSSSVAADTASCEDTASETDRLSIPFTLSLFFFFAVQISPFNLLGLAGTTLSPPLADISTHIESRTILFIYFPQQSLKRLHSLRICHTAGRWAEGWEALGSTACKGSPPNGCPVERHLGSGRESAQSRTRAWTLKHENREIRDRKAWEPSY